MSTDSMIVVGGPNYARTELLDLTTWTWDFVRPYPSTGQVKSAKVLFHEDSFYVFGAIIDDFSNDDIMKFDFNLWSVVGKLYSKRSKYSASLLGKMVYIVGGSGKRTNEKCEISSTVNCYQAGSTELEDFEKPTLFGFEYQECNIMAPYVEKLQRLFVIFVSQTQKPVLTRSRRSVQSNSKTIPEVHRKSIEFANSTMQATNKPPIKPVVKQTTKMKTSTTFGLTQNSTNLENDKLTTNSTTQLTSNKTFVSKFSNSTSNSSTSSNLTATSLTTSSTTQIISKSTTQSIYMGLQRETISPDFTRLTRFGDENLVGSPYTMELGWEWYSRFNVNNAKAILKQSCHVVHKGQLYFYGGKVRDRTRSIFGFNVSNQVLESLSKLEFDFINGACASNNRLIFLCFSHQDTKQCYKSLAVFSEKWWQKFIPIKKSVFAHESIDISMSSGYLILSFKVYL